MADPRDFHFALPSSGRPVPFRLEEELYPGVAEIWMRSTSRRIADPVLGVTTVVVHATAGVSSEDAVAEMRTGRVSFHWLVPDEDEPQHGHFAWACAPEARAAWHVRNGAAHPDVAGGGDRINHVSLGVEIVNRQAGADRFSDWQVAMTARIVRYAWAKYPNLREVVSHAKLDPGRRSDPGGAFPWAHFRRLVVDPPPGDLPALVARATPARLLAKRRNAANCCA